MPDSGGPPPRVSAGDASAADASPPTPKETSEAALSPSAPAPATTVAPSPTGDAAAAASGRRRQVSLPPIVPGGAASTPGATPTAAATAAAPSTGLGARQESDPPLLLPPTAQQQQHQHLPNGSFSGPPPPQQRQPKLSMRGRIASMVESLRPAPSDVGYHRHHADDEVDVNELIRRVSALDPEQRQVLKHHLTLYEAEDYHTLSAEQFVREPVDGEEGEEPAKEENKWKDELKAELDATTKPDITIGKHRYESLNYAGHDDHLVSRQDRVSHARDSFLKHRLGVWCVFILIGVITGITSYGVKMGEEFFGHWRLELMEKYVAQNEMNKAFLTNWAITLLFVTIASGITHFAPPAAGSGVPDVKALLNGVRIPGILSFRTFAVKVLGVIFGVASGLAMGPEGPMIHAGAIIASGVSQATVMWPFQWAAPFMQSFRNDTFKRDAVSAGAAAGVASAFGAPIGGLLFSMEEASSFWSHMQTWRTMITCCFATFTMMVLVYGGDRFNDPGLVHFGVAEETPTRYLLWELALWIPLGFAFGLIGAFFNFVSIHKIGAVNAGRKKFCSAFTRVGVPHGVSFFIITMFEVWAVATVVVLLNFELARWGDCLDTPTASYRNESNINGGRALHYMPFQCESVVVDLDSDGTPSKRYNDFATLSQLPQLQTIRTLLSRQTLNDGDPDIIGLRAVAIYFFVYFAFTVLTAGLYMPQGLFVPHIVIGALGGRFYGMLVHDYVGHTAQPGTYALMGAAGMLAGSTRITVSLSVIMFEITNDIQYLIPIMLVVVIAKTVGDLFNEPYYDCLLEMRHIPVLEEEPPPKIDLFHVGDLMHPQPRCTPRIAPVSELRALMEDTRHSCFPVTRTVEDCTMLGSISREAINVILRTLVNTHSKDMPAGSVAFNPPDRAPPPMRFKLFRRVEDNLRTIFRTRHETRYLKGVTFADDLCIDLLPYVNLSTFIVPPTFSLRTCFTLFRCMALRHVVVVNTAHAPIGILTREELQKHYLWVWKEREEERDLRGKLTLDSLNRVTYEADHNIDGTDGTQSDPSDAGAPTPFRRITGLRKNSMAAALEDELGSGYGGQLTSMREASFAAEFDRSVHHAKDAAKEGGGNSPTNPNDMSSSRRFHPLAATGRHQSMRQQLEDELGGSYLHYNSIRRAQPHDGQPPRNSSFAAAGGSTVLGDHPSAPQTPSHLASIAGKRKPSGGNSTPVGGSLSLASGQMAAAASANNGPRKRASHASHANVPYAAPGTPVGSAAATPAAAPAEHPQLFAPAPQAGSTAPDAL